MKKIIMFGLVLIITFGVALVFKYPPLEAKQVQYKNEIEIEDTLNLSDISKVLQKDFEYLKSEKIETKKKLKILTEQNKILLEANLDLNNKVGTKVIIDTIFIRDTIIRIDTLKKVKNFWGKEKIKN